MHLLREALPDCGQHVVADSTKWNAFTETAVRGTHIRRALRLAGVADRNDLYAQAPLEQPGE